MKNMELSNVQIEGNHRIETRNSLAHKAVVIEDTEMEMASRP